MMVKDIAMIFLAGVFTYAGLTEVGLLPTPAVYFGLAVLAFGFIWVEKDDEE